MKTKSHRKSDTSQLAVTRRTFAAGVGAAGLLAGSAPFQIGRAQGAALKVGVLLPRSGVQAGIGQDCQRGVEIAPGHPQGPGAAGPRHHERRHRIQRRGRALARRAADRRRCAAAGRRLRLRPEHGDRPGGRAEGHPVRHQHRGGPADHRAGLQVRVPQLPDRADDPGRRLRQPEGDLRGRRLGAEVGRLHARERHLRHGDAEGHRCRHAEVQHALQDRRDDRLRSGRARPFGRGGQGQGRPAPRRC